MPSRIALEFDGELAQDGLCAVFASVFTNDESWIHRPGKLSVHPADGLFDALALVVNRKKNFYIDAWHLTAPPKVASDYVR